MRATLPLVEDSFHVEPRRRPGVLTCDFWPVPTKILRFLDGGVTLQHRDVVHKYSLIDAMDCEQTLQIGARCFFGNVVGFSFARSAFTVQRACCATSPVLKEGSERKRRVMSMPFAEQESYSCFHCLGEHVIGPFMVHARLPTRNEKNVSFSRIFSPGGVDV